MSWLKYRRRKKFLEQINRIIPLGERIALIQPCNYKGEHGNMPYDLELIRYQINRHPSQIKKLKKSGQYKAGNANIRNHPSAPKWNTSSLW